MLLNSVTVSTVTDSYPVAFRWRKRGDAEDFGQEMRGEQRVMGRANSGKGASLRLCFLLSIFPTILCVPLKATGYESGTVTCSHFTGL